MVVRFWWGEGRWGGGRYGWLCREEKATLRNGAKTGVYAAEDVPSELSSYDGNWHHHQELSCIEVFKRQYYTI